MGPSLCDVKLPCLWKSSLLAGNGIRVRQRSHGVGIRREGGCFFQLCNSFCRHTLLFIDET